MDALPGGLRKMKCRLAAGAPLSVTAATSRPVKSRASSPGLPMVAEQNTKVGLAP